MQRSEIRVNLFLKVPAITLDSSPTASQTFSSGYLEPPPSILEVMSMADWALQRKVMTPHSSPASPTMAVNSKDSGLGTSVGGSSNVIAGTFKNKLTRISE